MISSSFNNPAVGGMGAQRWAHDVRNHMNALGLCTSALRGCDERSEQLELLDDIERAADALRQLVGSMPDEGSSAAQLPKRSQPASHHDVPP